MASGGSSGTGLPLWRGTDLAACSEADLGSFRMWSGFLPRGPSVRLDHNREYVSERGKRNAMFFQETRNRLEQMKTDLPLLAVSGVQGLNSWAAKEAVLHAQGIALGFACGRSFREALTIGQLCIDICDLYAEHGEGFLFWQALCRMNWGAASARFRRTDEAKAALDWVIQRGGIGSVGDAPSPAERPETEAGVSVIVAASHAHLCTLHLDMHAGGAEGSLDDAAAHAAQAIQLFEEHLPEHINDRHDREEQAAVLATAYANQGVCDVNHAQYDEGLVWYAKARTVAQECLDPEDALLAEIAVEVERAEKKKHYETLGVSDSRSQEVEVEF